MECENFQTVQTETGIAGRVYTEKYGRAVRLSTDSNDGWRVIHHLWRAGVYHY